MMRSRILSVLSACLVAATVAAGCGADVAPGSMVPVRPAERPLPGGVKLDPEVPKENKDNDCGDPTASLAPSGTSVPSGSTMDEIRKRGRLIAGVDQNTYLFGFRNPTTGELEGFDIDIVREIAERLLGDRSKVQFKALPASQRIDALKDGSVDLVAYTMTVTCERRKDVEFSSVYFESGQRILVAKGSDYKKVSDLGNKPVCAPAESTSLTNLAKEDPPPDLIAVDDLADCLLLLRSPPTTRSWRAWPSRTRACTWSASSSARSRTRSASPRATPTWSATSTRCWTTFETTNGTSCTASGSSRCWVRRSHRRRSTGERG